MKVLITADIHISDYANYNFTHQSRLKQYSLLADRLVELGKEHHCEELWILGDLLDKPNSRPYVLHEAQMFMYKVCSSFKQVRYILGNHDLDTKSQSLTEQDSQVTIFYFDNLIYMDQQLLTVGDKTYGFMNWRPEQDLDWIGDTHLDVLFGHYTKSTLFGQDIDETKFDLMIHGDIHNSQVIGKFVSVCNPIQKDMSSEIEGKVILFNTETAEWSRILVDPDNTRFLQMHYTKDPTKEGFETEFKYNIYKPDVITFEGDLQKSVEWSDINDLISKTCLENGLSELHNEITSKCVFNSDIDFNFQLTELDIHGFRSIEDLHLDFKSGDVIALLGSNGSGKTSIIKALQGVFSKNSDLKWEQSTFTNDMQLTVKLVYQNKLYEITKGSRWGLVIDGQEQGYSGIREFESDLIVKLPFLGYLDLIFLNSSTSDLSSQLSSSRRIELISKFYRLTQLESLHQTAMEMWKVKNTDYTHEKYQLDLMEERLKTYRTRLEELAEVEFMDKTSKLDTLKKYRDQRVELERYKLWSSSVSDCKLQKLKLEDSIKKLQEILTFNVSQAEIDVENLKKSQESDKIKLEDLKLKRSQFDKLFSEFNMVTQEGSALNQKLSTLQQGKCPECGASLVTSKYETLNTRYTEELTKLRSRWVELDAAIKEHPKGQESKAHYQTLITELESRLRDTFNSIELLSNKILNNKQYQGQLTEKQSQLAECESKLEKLLSNSMEEVILPANLEDLESDILSDISKIDERTELLKKLEDETVSFDLNKIGVEMIISECESLNKYMELTSNTGIIVEEILTRLAEKFSTPEIKYEVESGMYRGSRYISFNSFYLVKGSYRQYEQCSAGQKTVCDLDFLNRLFSTHMGLLVLDEYLKHLDDVNFSKVCGILTDMTVNTIILSTHDDNLTAYTKRLLLSLDDTGRTKCSVG